MELRVCNCMCLFVSVCIGRCSARTRSLRVLLTLFASSDLSVNFCWRSFCRFASLSLFALSSSFSVFFVCVSFVRFILARTIYYNKDLNPK